MSEIRLFFDTGAVEAAEKRLRDGDDVFPIATIDQLAAEAFRHYIPLPLSPRVKARYDRALARSFWREGQHGGFW